MKISRGNEKRREEGKKKLKIHTPKVDDVN
jgi:hypothetical protein